MIILYYICTIKQQTIADMNKNKRTNWIVWYKHDTADGVEFQDMMEFTNLIEALYWYMRVKCEFGGTITRTIYSFDIKLYRIK